MLKMIRLFHLCKRHIQSITEETLPCISFSAVLNTYSSISTAEIETEDTRRKINVTTLPIFLSVLR